MYGAVAIHAVTDYAFHTRHAILGFVAGGCRLINHNHQDSESLELHFGVAIHGVAVLAFLGFLRVE